MASTQQDSMLAECAGGSHEAAIEQPVTQMNTVTGVSSSEELLEQQRKYYFGAEDAQESRAIENTG